MEVSERDSGSRRTSSLTARVSDSRVAVQDGVLSDAFLPRLQQGILLGMETETLVDCRSAVRLRSGQEGEAHEPRRLWPSHCTANIRPHCSCACSVQCRCTPSTGSASTGRAERLRAASCSLTDGWQDLPGSVVSFAALSGAHRLTIKYVSHPGRSLSSFIKSSWSRYAHSPSTRGKSLQICNVATACIRLKSVCGCLAKMSSGTSFDRLGPFMSRSCSSTNASSVRSARRLDVSLQSMPGGEELTTSLAETGCEADRPR